MAARRGKSQARRNGGKGGGGGVPGWLLLVGGILIGLVVAVVAMTRLGGEPDAGPRPNPQAQAPAPAIEEAPVAQDAPRRPRYDFYTVLAEREVVVPDAEVEARARQEAEARAAQQRAAAERLAAAEAEATAPDTPSAPQPPPPAPTAPNNEAYVLQAGAFRAPAEAEALKARIALMGLSARVEAATINGDTVHRVRLGPFPSAEALARAKGTLESGGIPAVAVRAR
ncbi:SPOR domain-containing protein [Coralloluteibacterium thermophilus]|uniref:SPOR domain-containing protein n=1 Tax=Coralloluteibacterium thermophilum TaxID=2707049 RepID=A0ABV9NG95_9GAMM